MDELLKIPAVFVRGGTSRAVLFEATDLEHFSKTQIDSILLSVLGSPDNSGRQVDGLGGGTSSLSKAAIISKSSKPGIDVEFNFAQVGIKTSYVDWSGTCGNISSAVGPFAINQGLVELKKPVTEVTVLATNTGKTFLSSVPVSDEGPVPCGDFAIDGVPGTASKIALKFHDPGGSLGKGLLPTKSLIDYIKTPLNGIFKVSIIDVGIPTIFVAAEAFSYKMSCTLEDLDKDFETQNALEAIRCEVAVLLGISNDVETAHNESQALPKIVLIDSKSTYVSRAKQEINSANIDLRAIAISMGQAHRTYPVSVSMATAVAANIRGTLVSEIVKDIKVGRLSIGHPGGLMKLEVDVTLDGDVWTVGSATIFRTARTIMEGNVIVPTLKLR
tara:strand:- start:4952 stop:6112 length:1161 start_codon:yes stop_codon:yes gene_type:complete